MHCVSGAWKFANLSDAWKFAILSDAIHMAREHRQNAIQYLYLHLFTTKFVAILLTLTQKCHISQISNVQKVRHLEQPAADGWRTEQSRQVIQCKYYEQKIVIFLNLIIVNTVTSYFFTIYTSFAFETDIGKGVLAIDIYNFIRA